jgi:16S rRNA (uracil1498-N3)-methyltransferase
MTGVTPPVFLAEPDRLSGSGPVLLDGAEGRHAARVRRITVGERVELTDGAGTVASCRVLEARRDALLLEVLERRSAPPPTPRLVVVQALPKGDRGERAVEALTEVGVDEIVPWSASRCVTQWRGERGDRAADRWRAIGREAAKQSRRTHLPLIADLAGTSEVVARLRSATLAVAFHEHADGPVAALPVPAGGEMVAVIGPEGGLTDEELAAFVAAGALLTRLGPTVLRTSTAGVVAAAALLSRSPRW